MTAGRSVVAPPAYYEKVPQRDSFDASCSLESGPLLPVALTPSSSATGEAAYEDRQQREQVMYPIPEALAWTPDEVRHRVTYRLKPPASLGHLAADCAGVLGRSHEEALCMVRRAFPTALAPVPSSRILLSIPAHHQHGLPAGEGAAVRLSPDWFDAMFAPVPTRRHPAAGLLVDNSSSSSTGGGLSALAGVWNGLVEAFAQDSREWPTVIMVEIEPTEADIRFLHEAATATATATAQCFIATVFVIAMLAFAVLFIVLVSVSNH